MPFWLLSGKSPYIQKLPEVEETQPGGEWSFHRNSDWDTSGFTLTKMAGHKLLQHRKERFIKDWQA